MQINLPSRRGTARRSPVRHAAACALAAFVLTAASPTALAQSAVLPNVTYTASEVMNLWPGDGRGPGDTADIGPEHILENRPRPFDQITDVTVPTLSVFLPEASKANGTAILVIPGGGLQRLAIEHEGYEVAEWLNDHGIAAFLLKYRVPPRSRDQRWLVGVQDAERAMSIIRSRADEWGVDPDALGTIGFSAGGEINVVLSAYRNERHYDRIDAIDDYPTAPNFNIPIYGGGWTRFRSNEMREDIAERINGDTPPMFIVHAFDDGAQSSIILMAALKRANVPSELHIFGAGAHGFGARDTGLPVGEWRGLLMNWLAWQGFLDPPGVRTFASRFSEGLAADADVLPRFSSVARGGTMEDAFAAQKRVVRAAVAAGARVVGYKGAFTSEAAQASYDLGGPLHGVLFESGKLDAGDHVTLSFDPDRPFYVETEIGYVMAVDIGTKIRLPRQAMTAVEAAVPVIELPNNFGPRWGGVTNAMDVAAANAGSNKIIVGEAVEPASIADYDALPVVLRRDGATLHDATGADARHGQAQNLMTVINQIIDAGHVIHRGDIIVSGSLGAAHPAQPGHYVADFSALGRIEFDIR